MNAKKLCLAHSLIYLLFLPIPATAQIIPDRSLPNNSDVKDENGISSINEGTEISNNLFHSFESFSIPNGGTAYFNNSLDIQNVFSRVTGSSISNIDGLIRANGAANLFLLNPNGIVFGPNARLDLGGSFVGSTASSINFADGVRFSATSPEAPPLLTVDIPVGLGFGSNPGKIQVQNKGHQLVGAAFSPVTGISALEGLSVLSGKTLALLGGDVSLEGGILKAPKGNIELGSVARGVVSLSPNNSGWSFGYEGISSFKSVQLLGQALVDVSGFDSGSTRIQAGKIMIRDGSVILNQNQGTTPGGSSNIVASESLELTGGSQARIATSIRNETIGDGDAGKISISTQKLLIQTGGQINNFTFDKGKGGEIIVDAPSSIQLVGVSPGFPNVFSSINTSTFGSGDGGDALISTNKFAAVEGGTLASSTFGKGNAGDVNVNSHDSLKIVGYEPENLLQSTVGTNSLSSGNAGNINLNTRRLLIQDGGKLDSSTLANGNAGNINVKAEESVEVRNKQISSESPNSFIASSATKVNQNLQRLFRLPLLPTGNAGEVAIETPQLEVGNDGQISVRNDGTGDGGNLRINANSLALEYGGSILGSTASGEGGDIFLNSRNLQLRNGSSISATAGLAGGGGNGGNITIDTDTLAALNGSSITANAFTGRGGNIRIWKRNKLWCFCHTCSFVLV